MKTEKYSPNWLLQKIESSKTEAQKLLHIIEFQNHLIEELKQGHSLPIDSINGCWFNYNDTEELPNGYYKVLTSYEEEKEAEFYNGDWLDGNNCMEIDEKVQKYYR